MCCKW